MCKHTVHRRSVSATQSTFFPVVWTFRCFPNLNDDRQSTTSISAISPLPRQSTSEAESLYGISINSVVYFNESEPVLSETVIFLDAREFSIDAKNCLMKTIHLQLDAELQALSLTASDFEMLQRWTKKYVSKIPTMIDIAGHCEIDSDFSISFLTSEDLGPAGVLPDGAELTLLSIESAEGSVMAKELLQNKVREQVYSRAVEIV